MNKRIVPEVTLLVHSAIRIQGDKTVYIDPFHLEEAPHDADVIAITHEHHDHLSSEDMAKVARESTVFVLPLSCRQAAEKAGLAPERCRFLAPYEAWEQEGLRLETVPAYNVGKPFHTRDKNWLGYVVQMQGKRYYIAGDTDNNEDVRKVRCDVALLPVGGTYTMTAPEAAALANAIHPAVAIPTHYGDIVGNAKDADSFFALLDSSIRQDRGLAENNG